MIWRTASYLYLTTKKTMRNYKAIFLTALLAMAPPFVHAIEIGAAAPDCHLTKLSDGSALPLHQPGKVVYVDFWASWCGPCMQSMPFMNELHDQLKSQDFEIIAVNLDEERKDADGFLEKFPAKFTIAGNADMNCPSSFGVQAMPSSYIIDRQGKVRHIQLGFHQSEVAEIRQKVQNLLNEK